MRYLQNSAAVSALRAGRTVEALLPERFVNESRVIRYLSLQLSREEGYVVTLQEAWDQGSPEFIDIYDFTTADQDNPWGVSRAFASAEEALSFAIEEMGAEDNRFMNNGVIQDEYEDRYWKSV